MAVMSIDINWNESHPRDFDPRFLSCLPRFVRRIRARRALLIYRAYVACSRVLSPRRE